MLVTCEVCGSCLGSAAIIPCQEPGCTAGCHSFCLPGPQHRTRLTMDAYRCTACSSAGSAAEADAAAEAAAAICGAAASTHPAAAAAAAGAGGTHSPGGPTPLQGRAAAPGPVGSWSQLPPELLQGILSRVPQKERLCCCAPVSSAWAAAAAAATQSISIERSSRAALQQAWAACGRRFASQLTHLSLERSELPGYSSGPCRLQLACPRLQSLEVSRVHVTLRAAPVLLGRGGRPRPGPGPVGWGAAPGLTRLSLRCAVAASDAQAQLAALAAACTKLQDLCLHLEQRPQPQPQTPMFPDSFVEQLGRRLTQLTRLELSAVESQFGQHLWTPATAMGHVTRLTRLRDLSLCCNANNALAAGAAAGPQQVPTLTRLALRGCEPSAIPCLHSLRHLQVFELHDNRWGEAHMQSQEWDPAVLSGVTSLRELSVEGQLYPCCSSLLGVLQQLTLLTRLYLECLKLEVQVDAEAHAAVTASSELRMLDLPELPPDTWQYVFRPGRTLQQLTSLTLASERMLRMSAGQLQLLVQACPALRQLGLHPGGLFGRYRGSWRDLQLGLLSGLTGLTKLSVSAVEDRHVPQLLRLRQLLDMQLPHNKVDAEELLALTALRQLTQLHVAAQRWSARCWGLDCTFVQTASQPVWVQLQECCQATLQHKEEWRQAEVARQARLHACWWQQGESEEDVGRQEVAGEAGQQGTTRSLRLLAKRPPAS